MSFLPMLRRVILKNPSVLFTQTITVLILSRSEITNTECLARALANNTVRTNGCLFIPGRLFSH